MKCLRVTGLESRTFNKDKVSHLNILE